MSGKYYFAVTPSGQAALFDAWREVPAEGKVPAAGLHMTLVFVGAADGELLSAIGDEAATVPGLRRHSISLDTVEHWRGPRCLVLTNREGPGAELFFLREVVRKRLPVETRASYQPHITLAKGLPRGAALGTPTRVRPVILPVDGFSLLRSSGGGLHEVVRTWVLP